MREIVTRYGREGIGFLWVIGEPLAFCLGVIILWSALKPAYEHGIRLGPFVMTGYMSLLLMRHLVTHGLSALQANVGLMYHRVISPLHIFVSRFVLEIAGTTTAFAVVYVILAALGQVGLPKEPLLLYGGEGTDQLRLSGSQTRLQLYDSPADLVAAGAPRVSFPQKKRLAYNRTIDD